MAQESLRPEKFENNFSSQNSWPNLCDLLGFFLNSMLKGTSKYFLMFFVSFPNLALMGFLSLSDTHT